MSAARGIDYINHDLLESLEEPPMALEIDPDVSVVGHVLERFRHDGMAKWHRRTVEWLAVYLVTEIGSTPHNIRHGRAGCSITNAYLKIVQNLVSSLPGLRRPPLNPATERSKVSRMGAEEVCRSCPGVPHMH